MYGSQTGNAQSIAKSLHEGCKGRGIESSLLKCDAWKKARNQSVGCCSLGTPTFRKAYDGPINAFDLTLLDCVTVVPDVLHQPFRDVRVDVSKTMSFYRSFKDFSRKFVVDVNVNIKEPLRKSRIVEIIFCIFFQ